MDSRKPSGEYDSIRVSARDLFLVLRLFVERRETSLENIRLRICLDRKKRRGGDYLATTARDIAAELQKLDLVKGGPFPKSSRDFPRLKDRPIRITPAGTELLDVFERDRGAAFDDLFGKMFKMHRYLRDYAITLAARGWFIAPVLTSFKDHVAPEYASASFLTQEVGAGIFRTDSLNAALEKRIQRQLDDKEQQLIRESVERMVCEMSKTVGIEDPTTVAKNILGRLNDIVVPAILGRIGLTFDFRTHRTIWALGEEFKVWATTTSHPGHPGTLIFRTATLRIEEKEHLSSIEFDASASKLSERFLARLYQSYIGLQKHGRGSFVPAWELRATFCFEHHCQPSTFNQLFEQQYSREDSQYEIHTEIQQQRPRGEQPLRAGNRNVGLVLVSRREQRP